MGSTTPIFIPARLQSLAATASLLERLERQPLRASATQYRDVARLLDSLLTEAAPGAELDALLGASPALAELYENQHYAQAGLCRSPLEAGLKAELVAAATQRRAARMAA
jgi:hypothetical protein